MSIKETKLASKLVNILDSMSGVQKKGFNKNQNYFYMREVDVLEALKTELVKHKIILLTSSKLVDISPKEKTDKNGNKQTEFITTVETSHTFVDSESGEQLTITSVGSGYDSTDKGSAKAITSATKYALLKTFMISDEGADVENDGETKVSTSGFGQQPSTPSFKGFGNNVTNKNITATSSTDPNGNTVTTQTTTPETFKNVNVTPFTTPTELPKANKPSFARRNSTQS